MVEVPRGQEEAAGPAGESWPLQKEQDPLSPESPGKDSLGWTKGKRQSLQEARTGSKGSYPQFQRGANAGSQ